MCIDCGGDFVEGFGPTDDERAGDAEMHEGVGDSAAEAGMPDADDARLEALREGVVDGVDERTEEVEDCSVGKGFPDRRNVAHGGVEGW